MKEKQTIYCPNCDLDIECDVIPYSETIEVRGETFEVEGDMFQCPKCGVKFIDFDASRDPLAEAYSLYREAHNMMKPEEIIQIRKSYNLSQQELADLLDISRVTLSRYENGALQEPSHDYILQSIRIPSGLLERIQKKPHVLSIEKYEKLMKKLLPLDADINNYSNFTPTFQPNRTCPETAA